MYFIAASLCAMNVRSVLPDGGLMGTEFQLYRVKRIVEMDGVVKGGHHYFKWCCFYQPVCVLTDTFKNWISY